MVHKLIAWALDNPLIVIGLTLVLIVVGTYSYIHINVEAYPDPSPPIIEIVAQYPGASAEEVERQVTIPLEITLAGMPNQKVLRSKSLFGLSHLRTQFEYSQDYDKAKQDVINRLQFTQPLPPGVTPQLSPQSPTGEIFRYTLRSARDPSGRDYYNLNDLKSIQDWTLEREFRRVPRIIDVTSRGGSVKRYEIQLDYDRMRQKGITLSQVQTALSSANANAGGDYVRQGPVAMNARSVGLIGGGQDPLTLVLGLADPAEAVRLLRAEEGRRLREVRQIVLTSNNNVPILLEDVVEGGRLLPGQDPTRAPGVVVGHQTRLGRSCLTVPGGAPDGRRTLARDEDDKVECVVLMRRNEATLPALKDVRERVKELNDPATGRLPPGVEIETYYDRSELIGVTTETVQENLILGMALVAIILLMFLSNVKSAVIVAINIPLALLFAFSVLYMRGKSANLLSIGAVDFGIIVDSSVIMVENIYRRLSTGTDAHLPVNERILRACIEVEKALFFSTTIIVVAFVPLFTMQGAEGQIFGPMADTYAFALGGALLLALTVSPVLCFLFLKHLKPVPDNFLVKYLRDGYLRNLRVCLRNRWITVALFFGAMAFTYIHAVPQLGREFMPELEEGNLWIRSVFPLNAALETVTEDCRKSRSIIARYPEVATVVTEIGRPDDGTDPSGFYNAEFFVPLRAHREWPKVMEDTSWRRWVNIDKSLRVDEVRLIGTPADGARVPADHKNLLVVANENDKLQFRQFDDEGKLVVDTGEKWLPNRAGLIADVRKQLQGLRPPHELTAAEKDRVVAAVLPVVRHLRPRTKPEIVKQLNEELESRLPGADWNFSQNIRDNVMEAMSGVKGNNSIKIFGPDIQKLEDLAVQVRDRLRSVPGIAEVGVFNIKGQTNLEFRIDLEKCKKWGVSAADVNNVITSALGGQAFSAMIEGERKFDISTRLPPWRRGSESSILDIPIDVTNNQVIQGTGPGPSPSPTGSGVASPSRTGTLVATENTNTASRIRLRDVVSPVGPTGAPDPNGSFERAGASTIYREQGQRMIAIKFSVRDRDLAGAVDEAKDKTRDLVVSPYRAVWSGEFEQMQEAEARLIIIIPASLVLIFLLLYFAFRSVLDACLVLVNVLALSLGGIWALLLTETNFSVSAAVGFVSIFGVAIMDGLLLVSYFNQNRAHGMPVWEAILDGAAVRVRPVMMTGLTAILGLLPAALATRIGSETQKPLAIVVIGGMVTTLFLTRYLMPVLYSFYGHREPPAGASSMAH
ncbi:efflux RND transporter permease subunit [Frigoriglobus tundricola]|uniref:CzcABC family efflux RND transporter, transmembrane protein n=1 Tax=Frigoriglobus tundricola TaxID=2774151 RepID=A0A6M5Z3W7_9BACT|nr:efflux RND transporter permease subunit [Frigoriglobus tundricola]QJX00164.1 CzcABC family efflux RND transporter, transmembrane protein [Frigoriglobus tundricola]